MKKITIFMLFLALFAACQQESKQPQAVAAPPAAAPAPVASAASPAALKVGSTLYVHAASGSVLRQTPSKDGVKVASVPANGQPLKVLEQPDPANRYVAEQIGTFAVGGGWVKVQTSKGEVGYLFEGYLSRYAPLTEPISGQVALVDAFYQHISTPKGNQEALPANPEAPAGYRQMFADGTKFEMTPYAGGHSEQLTIPSGTMTMQEALVLFRRVWFDKSKTRASYDAGKKTLQVVSEDELQQMTIEEKGGNLFLEFSYAD